MSDPKDKIKGWAATLDDEPEESGLQADIARKILAMNPALRDAGIDTVGAMKQTQKREPASNERIVDMLAAAKRKLVEEHKRIDAELLRIKAEKQALAARSFDKLARWLRANDPELRSPVTQQTLSDEKVWLDRIGFSVKRYMDKR